MLELQALQNFSRPALNSQAINAFQSLLESVLSGQGILENKEEISKPAAKTSFVPAAPAQWLPPINLTKLAAHKTDFEGIIEKASKTHNVPAALIKAVIKTESNFNPNAVSHAGASAPDAADAGNS